MKKKIITIALWVSLVLSVIFGLNIIGGIVMLPEGIMKYRMLTGVFGLVTGILIMDNIQWWWTCKRNYKKREGKCTYWPCRYKKECKYSKYCSPDLIPDEIK
jgi:hypothetical protein